MRVLVTGGAGFVGSHLVEKLVSLDHKVDVLDDLSNGRKDNLRSVWRRIGFHELDVSQSLIKPLLKHRFDAIYHLPCFPRSRSFEDPKRDVEVNVIGMVNVLELAKKDKPRIIFSSNSGIYDTSKMPIDENTPDDPKTPYDLDKLQGERYLKLYRDTFGIEHVIFRFATVYGPRQSLSPKWKPVVLEFINSLLKHEPPVIHWDGEQTRDFIYVDDIVNALVLALDNKNANGETMILGSGRETSINELYSTVSRILGANLKPKHEPKKLGDIRQMRYNCQKAQRILGWKAATTLEQGVRKTVEYQKRAMGTRIKL